MVFFEFCCGVDLFKDGYFELFLFIVLQEIGCGEVSKVVVDNCDLNWVIGVGSDYLSEEFGYLNQNFRGVLSNFVVDEFWCLIQWLRRYII